MRAKEIINEIGHESEDRRVSVSANIRANSSSVIVNFNDLKVTDESADELRVELRQAVNQSNLPEEQKEKIHKIIYDDSNDEEFKDNLLKLADAFKEMVLAMTKEEMETRKQKIYDALQQLKAQ